jgi:hypothetical protein
MSASLLFFNKLDFSMKYFGRKIGRLMESGWVHLACILLFCYLAFALPVQLLGLPSGFDMLTNVQFAVAFQDAISTGHLFPSWANDNFGYGSIGIRFYPPVSTFFLAVTQLLTNDWFTAFLINIYVWIVAGCVGMYLFVKEWGTAYQGLLAAALYAIVPQHLSEIFQFFMFAEFAVWGVLPFCFLYVTRVCRGGSRVDTILFAVSYSVLILTHLPTTIIVSLCLPVYVLLLTDWSKYKQVLVHLLAAIGLTLLATAFRWVVLVDELTWIAHNGPEHYGSGYYDFSLWLFPNILATRSAFLYVLTSWLFDISIVLTIALLIPALIVVLQRSESRNEPARRLLIGSLAIAFFAFFMLSRPSFYVWENITLLQKLQFPWRWLSVMSMFCVVLFSLSVPYLVSKFTRFERLIAYPALALVVTIALFDITQIIIPSAPLQTAKMEQIDEKVKTEQIWRGWWPTWAKEEAFEKTELVLADGRKVEITAWDLESKDFVVQVGEPMNVRVKNFYYPLWKATVNGQTTEISKDVNGAITIPVSAEASRVHLYFEEPLINNVAYGVSLVTWLFPLFLLPVYYWRKYVALINRRPLLDEEFDYS